MSAMSITEMPKLFAKAQSVLFPCEIQPSSLPGIVNAIVRLGDEQLYIEAWDSKVDTDRNLITAYVVGEVGDSYLVQFPGEVLGRGSTVQVQKRLLPVGGKH